MASRMRLLVPTRISLALRRVTNSSILRPPSDGDSVVPSAAVPLHVQQQLQQLWELSKETRDGLEPLTKREVHELKEGRRISTKGWAWAVVERLREDLEFASIEKLLMLDPRFDIEQGKIPDVKLVTEVLWAAVLAKSLGAVAPSILDWIDKAVRRLPEPFPKQKDLIIWLLSILRDDLPMLQKLRQESSSTSEGVGPEIERYKTLRHAALAYLTNGKRRQFRSLWTSSGTPLLAEAESLNAQHTSALLHHALLRTYTSGKLHPSLLRWYAESLVSNQRTPIPAEPQFEMMMTPVISALGGRIEKWTEGDTRISELRKWRNDYDNAELDKLVHSMFDYMRHKVVVEKRGSRKDLSRLEDMLSRLNSEKRQPTVIIDWLNFVAHNPQSSLQMNSYFPSCQLVVVGREKINNDDWTPKSPVESERIKVMEVTSKREKKQEVDDFCSMVLAVATRGHLLSNDKIRPHIEHFGYFVKSEFGNITRQATLLKNYLNDAILRHHPCGIQRAVDHSKAAQWIDKEKKELAFTVARRIPKFPRDAPYRKIEYYSLHID